MRNFFFAPIAVVSTLALNQIALAADLPRKAPTPIAAPVFSWTGFYVGGNVGYGWGHSSNDFSFVAPDLLGGTNCSTTALCLAFADSRKLNGVIGGLQAGYNWQWGNFLTGIETDFQGSGQDGDGNISLSFIKVNVPTTAFLNYNEKIQWFGTLRGRLGYVADRWLLYVTGGLAYAHIKLDGSAAQSGRNSGVQPAEPACPTSPCLLANFSLSDTRVGWTVGGGVEWAVAGNWSLKAEYLYMDLGSLDTSFPTFPGCFGAPAGVCIVTQAGVGTIHSKLTDNIARVGLNYKFN